MPTHPILGEYIVDADCVEFAPMTIDGNEVEPCIYKDETPIPDDLMEKFLALFSKAQELATDAKTHVVETWKETYLELVDDLVESNPDMEILEEIFPGKGITNTDQLTKDLVAGSLHVENVMGGYYKNEPRFTADVRFKEALIDQLFAVKYDIDGNFQSIQQES